MAIFTRTLTNVASFTVAATEGKTFISIQWISGTVTVLGTGKLGNLVSTAVSLSSTVNSVTIASQDNTPISDVTIDASAGSCAVVAI